MFEVDKPRRFHYEPRFYDPEKERWEALKKKHADEQKRAEFLAAEEQKQAVEDDDLAYFQQRVRDIASDNRKQPSRLGWRDLFRKRKMPTFNPQFHHAPTADTTVNPDSDASDISLTEKYRLSKRQIKIKRRFDMGDTEYMKPVSGSKIILYTFLVFLLVTLILRF